MRNRPRGGVTGVFYHPSFSRKSYLTGGQRLTDFPGALGSLRQSSGVRLFECEPVTDELILLAHATHLIPEVEADPF